MGVSGVTLYLEGDEALARTFNELEAKIQRKLIRPALRKAAKVMKTFVLAEVSRLSNTPQPAPHLADFITVKAMKRDRSKSGRIGFVVILGGRADLQIAKDTYYPAHIEYGYIHVGPEGGPGRHIPANPFMKRALAAGRGAAEAAFVAELRRRMATTAGLDSLADDDLADVDASAEEVTV